MALRPNVVTSRIIECSHLPFGRRSDDTVESLIVAAASQALTHAKIDPASVDEIFVGHFNAGFSPQSSPQSFTAALALQANPSLRFQPSTRLENACATGSAAIHTAALRAIESNCAQRALVIGVEHMSSASAEEAAQSLLRASYLPEDGEEPVGFAGVFARIASAYFRAYGDQSDALARIAAKNC
jgi:acetyl-CoA C-acetyltransferase